MSDEFFGGYPDGPVDPPRLEPSHEQLMRARLTALSAALFVAFTVLEVVAATSKWDVGAQCAITGAIGFFLGTLLTAYTYYFTR